MQLHGIRAKGKRRFKATTDSKHDLPIAPNLLDRQFTAAEPDKVWAGDINYRHSGEGWLFPALVIDRLSRQAVGWCLHEDMTRDSVADVRRMAWFKRHPSNTAGLMFHSDRGSQYASNDFRGVLNGYGITASISRRCDCRGNAGSDMLFGSLKVQRLYAQRFDPGAKPKMKSSPGCSGTASAVCTRRWPVSARCGSGKTGLRLNPSKPIRDSAMGYGLQGKVNP